MLPILKMPSLKALSRKDRQNLPVKTGKLDRQNLPRNNTQLKNTGEYSSSSSLRSEELGGGGGPAGKGMADAQDAGMVLPSGGQDPVPGPTANPQPKPPTNATAIGELGEQYRAVVPGEHHQQGDFAFIGRLYSEFGYDLVFLGINDLAYRIEAGHVPESPLVYLRGIIAREVMQVMRPVLVLLLLLFLAPVPAWAANPATHGPSSVILTPASPSGLTLPIGGVPEVSTTQFVAVVGGLASRIYDTAMRLAPYLLLVVFTLVLVAFIFPAVWKRVLFAVLGFVVLSLAPLLIGLTEHGMNHL